MSDQPQQEQASAWILKSKRVLGTLMFHNEEWFDKAVYGTGLKVSDFPPVETFRQCFETLLAIRADKTVLITPENVWTYSGRQVSVAFCEELMGHHDTDIFELVSDAKLVVKLGQRAYRLYKAQAAATAYLDESRDEEEITRQLIQDMSVLRAVEIRDASFKAIAGRIRDDLIAGKTTLVTPTGIKWLDTELKGGLRSQRYIAIGAREKGRKTTVLRNVLLGAAREFVGWRPLSQTQIVPVYKPREKVSIALLAFENDQRITIWDFIAMLAYEYLYYRRYQDEKFSDEFTLGDVLSGEDLQTGYEAGDWKDWGNQHFREAVLWAVAEAEKLKIYIYDSQPENGGLKTRDDVDRIINMHRGSVAKEDEHLIFAIDYAQLVEDTGDVNKDLRRVSALARQTAIGLNSTMIVLSQFNRDTNKMNARKEDTGDVMGTYGGASIEQDCTNYIEVIYDVDGPDGEFRIELRHRRARRGKSSRAQKCYLSIHPASGLVLLKPPPTKV